ncbi:hypothetical protein VPH35_063511 [Triticum aestivum]|uniref:Prolamin-like domain-containing protein n=1 Tax=Aegilops tauschii TaxID=37682 RepID=M8BCN3_AEGTA
MAAFRHLSACSFCMCLLLTVAFAGVPNPPTLPPGFHSRDDCYRTVTGVPSWCSGEFIRALFPGIQGFQITDYCCLLLTCVGESSCDSALRAVCRPPEADRPCGQ